MCSGLDMVMQKRYEEGREGKKKKIRGFWLPMWLRFIFPSDRRGFKIFIFSGLSRALFTFVFSFSLFHFFNSCSQCCIYLVSIYPIARLSGRISSSEKERTGTLTPNALFIFILCTIALLCNTFTVLVNLPP